MERDYLTHILYSSNDASTYPHPPPLFFISFSPYLYRAHPSERRKGKDEGHVCTVLYAAGEKEVWRCLSLRRGRPAAAAADPFVRWKETAKKKGRGEGMWRSKEARVRPTQS